MIRGIGSMLAALALIAAGGGAPPYTAPSPPPAGIPSGLSVFTQSVTLTSNEVDLSWIGSAAVYRLFIGSSRGASDVQTVDVPSTAYHWSAPRTANTYYARVSAVTGEGVSTPSGEITITTLDLRHVIDALFFSGGPMSEFLSNQPPSAQAGAWPDGTRLRVMVSAEAGEKIRALAQTAIDDYASIVGGAITGVTALVDDDMHALRSDQLPPFTIALRILPVACLDTAAGCASYGPAPLGPNAAIVTFVSNGSGRSLVTHELGHTYGLHHLRRANPDRPEFRFVMSSPSGAEELSQPERAAIAAVHAGGPRGAMSRAQAEAAGLVLPSTGPGTR